MNRQQSLALARLCREHAGQPEEAQRIALVEHLNGGSGDKKRWTPLELRLELSDALATLAALPDLGAAEVWVAADGSVYYRIWKPSVQSRESVQVWLEDKDFEVEVIES